MDDLVTSPAPTSGLPIGFYGILIHTPNLTTLEILENSLIIVDNNGKIQALQTGVEPGQINSIITELGYAPDVFPIKYLPRGQFLCPGFIDTHNHAPQWTQRGIGRGKTLLEWLNDITFAHEAKFADTAYARQTYSSVVLRLAHGEATRILADVCLEKGQRALVGKCNMNRHAPDWYRDLSVNESLEQTREVIRHIQKIDPDNKLVQAVLTPRFAVSCEPDLLMGIGEIAKEYPDLPIQTHFNEAQGEIEFTRSLFPEFRTETELYGHFGLLNERSILAHCIYLAEEEIQTLEQRRCGVAHCPISNTTMDVFMVAPIREYLRRGIKVGLGTDCGGGHSISMLECMRQAFVVSIARQTSTEGKDEALSLVEGFFLATLGGAQVCGLDHKVGSFAVGKEFDALEVHAINEENPGTMTPVEEEDSLSVIFEKWVMTGDDRNIAKVYIRGRSVKA
ncbi:hypothetical protein N7468_008472 [Penicillium chermesinum]|uniref:Probable guanine deaminase n=1 Tax=Penicillium chermesinum TaxID=63820 RepID=A0A9W9NPS8_9EURO|nr:uncharacterized protein N7468_008472 [Penicillium chermesinum]KAJ5223930.1 hypothetical protein N7468_008472 [Penicillium chermesinum]